MNQGVCTCCGRPKVVITMPDGTTIDKTHTNQELCPCCGTMNVGILREEDGKEEGWPSRNCTRCDMLWRHDGAGKVKWGSRYREGVPRGRLRAVRKENFRW